MTTEYKLAIMLFVMIGVILYALYTFLWSWYDNHQRIKTAETLPKITKYKDVGMMEGTWKVNGVLQPVYFAGVYKMWRGKEISATGEESMNGKLEYAYQKRGYIWSHHPYEDDVLIPISAISEINVEDVSYVIPLAEEKEEDED